MRIGIFSDSINLPPKEGINVHTYSVACALSAHTNVEVFLVVCDRGWLNLDILPEQPFTTIVLPCSSFYNTSKIEEIVTDYRLDVLQTYMVYFAATVLGDVSARTRVPMCVEFHDLEQAIVPLYGGSKKETRFNHQLQHRSASLASLVRMMSLHDYKEAQMMWPEIDTTMWWAPVAVPDPLLPDVSRRERPFQALFIGNTSYPPNENAALFISNTLAPATPSVPYSLVGRATERYSGPNITSYGMVDDIRPFLAGHALGLAPIFEGSGMKIKLLDYLSAGMTVLTTSIGAQGYPPCSGIIIEDDTAQWPAIIQGLRERPTLLRQGGVAARKVFLDRFNLDSSVETLINKYAALTFSPVRQPSDFPPIKPKQSDIYWLREMREVPRKPVKKALVVEAAN